jgi:hypothetical protein
MFRTDRTGNARRRAFMTLAGTAVTALAVLATACGDAPTSPAASISGAPSTGSAHTTITVAASTVAGLLWTKPVTQATASAVIGTDGGSITVPNGVRHIEPKGAVTTNVAFSVTRLPGTIVAYDFEPHGTFALPLTIQQPTLGTNLFKLDPVTAIEGAYFLGASSLNQLTGTATVAEFEPTFVSADKAWITFTVKHFSGYVIATGRSGAQ